MIIWRIETKCCGTGPWCAGMNTCDVCKGRGFITNPAMNIAGPRHTAFWYFDERARIAFSKRIYFLRTIHGLENPIENIIELGKRGLVLRAFKTNDVFDITKRNKWNGVTTQQVAFARCHSEIVKEIELNEDTALIVACLLSKVKPR